MENSIAQVIESYLALVPDRRKHEGIVQAVIYILFLNYFFGVKSVKLLLLGYEMHSKKIRGKKKFSCNSKIVLNVAVHKKKFKKEYITPDYRLLEFFLDCFDG